MGSTVFRNPRALSSALAALGTLQPRALGFLNTVDPLDTVSNCYISTHVLMRFHIEVGLLPWQGIQHEFRGQVLVCASYQLVDYVEVTLSLRVRGHPRLLQEVGLGGREGGRQAGREAGREGGREGGREKEGEK